MKRVFTALLLACSFAAFGQDSVLKQSTSSTANKTSTDYTWAWISGSALLAFALGFALGKIVKREFSASPRNVEERGCSEKRSTEQQGGASAYDMLVLEKKNEGLEKEVKEAGRKIAELKRKLDEQEKLLNSGSSKALSNRSRQAGKQNLSDPPTEDRGVTFYMPQPNMLGRFQESSKTSDATNALYEFVISPRNPQVAKFKFIARGMLLRNAIGNEPTWIAAACERTNQPSDNTTSVHSDYGRATLKDGEWEITDKAKITYQ